MRAVESADAAVGCGVLSQYLNRCTIILQNSFLFSDAGDSLWVVMADGLGGGYNHGRLALADERLNGRKGSLFGGRKLDRET